MLGTSSCAYLTNALAWLLAAAATVVFMMARTKGMLIAHRFWNRRPAGLSPAQWEALRRQRSHLSLAAARALVDKMREIIRRSAQGGSSSAAASSSTSALLGWVCVIAERTMVGASVAFLSTFAVCCSMCVFG